MSNLQFCEQCGSGYLTEQGHRCQGAPLLKLQVTEALPPLRLFLVQDWAYVAAYSREEAMDWHRHEFSDEEVDPDYCDEVSAELTMRDGDPDDQNAPTITMRTEMDRMLTAGHTPPFLVAVDGHYA